MVIRKLALVVCCAVALGICGCSRQQSDWEKTRAANTTESYEQFLKKYPAGEFTAQAQARVKELYEERDWQKARDTDTLEGYQAFLKQYPEGKWTEEARIRVENFSLAQTPGAATPPAGADAAGAAGTPSSGDEGAKPAGRAPAAAKPAAQPSAGPTPKQKADSGTFGIQLGAFKSGAEAANRHWAHLQKKYPTLLAGLTQKVVPKKTAAGTIYRLRAMGLTVKRARAICKSLKTKSQPCTLVRP
jgi:cell division septation protein DedD